VQLATRLLRVSDSGSCKWRGRAPSAHTVRHAWFTGQIAGHEGSRGTYEALWVHAERYLLQRNHERATQLWG
jgi:hypothetical protein